MVLLTHQTKATQVWFPLHPLANCIVEQQGRFHPCGFSSSPGSQQKYSNPILQTPLHTPYRCWSTSSKTLVIADLEQGCKGWKCLNSLWLYLNASSGSMAQKPWKFEKAWQTACSEGKSPLAASVINHCFFLNVTTLIPFTVFTQILTQPLWALISKTVQFVNESTSTLIGLQTHFWVDNFL